MNTTHSNPYTRSRLSHGMLQCCCTLLCLGLFPVSVDAQIIVHDPNAMRMVEAFKGSLFFPTGASLRMTVEVNGTWHYAAAAEGASEPTKRTDEWVVRSDAERYGKELHRKSPEGEGRWRSVIVDRQLWVFEHNLNAGPNAPVLGEFFIRSPLPRFSRWRMPLTDYLDRAFVMPNQFGDMPSAMKTVGPPVDIDGHPCQQIEGVWNDRQITFWLDPDHGCLPRRYAMHTDFSLQDYEVPDSIPGKALPPIVAPPGMEGRVDRPVSMDERLGGVVLEQIGNSHYIAKATVERTTNFEGGVSYTNTLNIAVSDFKFGVDPEASTFVNFTDVLREGTRMEEHLGGRRFTPELFNYYIWENGQFVPTAPPAGEYWPRLQSDLKRLAFDFSLENLKRVDSKFLLVVCAATALSINGAMAYVAHRKKKSST